MRTSILIKTDQQRKLLMLHLITKVTGLVILNKKIAALIRDAPVSCQSLSGHIQ